MPNEETRTCYDCGIEKLLSAFPLSRGENRGLRCSNCAAKAYRKRLRIRFLEAFDFKCTCCGVDNPLFLTLDHVQGGQRALRRLQKQGLEPSFYEYARAVNEGIPRDKYDCLCFNCNCAKGFFGECPHKSGVTRDAAIAKLREGAVYKTEMTTTRRRNISVALKGKIPWNKGIVGSSESSEDIYAKLGTTKERVLEALKKVT